MNNRNIFLIWSLLFFILIPFIICGEDYYSILGISRDASSSQISKAYRQLAKMYHPDKHKGKPNHKEMLEKFQKISNAYEVISDPEKRRKYDQYGEEGLKQQRGGFTDPFDIFNFNFMQRENRQEMQKGPSLTIEVQVTLEDLYKGKNIEILQRRQTLCPKCRGTGAKDPNDVQICKECDGTGVKVVTQRLGPGFVTKTQTTCDRCGGKGKIVTSQCDYCHGTKISRGDQLLNIYIERGMADGHEIKSEEDADEAPDRNPGDLIFKLFTLPHKRFTRKGNDLYMQMYISLLQSLVGFSKSFAHLDGHEVRIERSEVTPPGYVLKLNGEGMPHHESPDITGDLYITFNIQFPTKLSTEQIEAFKKLLNE